MEVDVDLAFANLLVAEDLLSSFQSCHQGVLQLAEENLVGVADRDETSDDAIRLEGIAEVVGVKHCELIHDFRSKRSPTGLDTLLRTDQIVNC